MDRWLEEYFAELETVFGLGLFSMLRSGGLDDGDGGVQTYAGSSAPDERQAWKKTSVQDEVLGFSAALEEQEMKINRRVRMESDAFYEAAMAESGFVWESGRPAAETRAAEEERQEVMTAIKTGGEGVTASGTEQNEWDGLAEAFFPGADSFEALLSPAVLMEKAEPDDGGERGAEKGQAIWREAVTVRGRAEEDAAAGCGVSAEFPEGRAAEGDEMIDRLLDELERRLMLEVGGAAEGRY